MMMTIRLTVKQAATYIPVSESVLNHLRTRGGGPPYIKIGRRILYDQPDLDAWMQTQKRSATTDPRGRKKPRM